jgi:hypothetical protein
MTDNARNTRTLISAFVVAILVLIPLRFYEIGQTGTGGMEVSQYTQILGESCVDGETAESEIGTIYERIVAEDLNREEIDELLGQIEELESRSCD